MSSHFSFAEAIELINSFWPATSAPPPFKGGGIPEVERVANEWQRELPSQLQEYLRSYAPTPASLFSRVGNPIDLYDARQIRKLALGYNFNPVTQQVIASWSDDWMLIGDEGADPIIIDLSAAQNASGNCQVLQAMHGAGDWDFAPIADSLPQFLLLLSAQEHTWATYGNDDDMIIDDEKGFNLSPLPAAWLFPFMHKYAGEYYSEWTRGFDNA